MKYIQQSPSRFCGPFVNGARRNVVFVVTALSSFSVFSQVCVQVSACLVNVSCRAVAAFDLVYRSLSVLCFYCVLDVG